MYENAVFNINGEIPDIDVKANEMLSSVFRNILNNAVHHNDKEKPKIDISAKKEDDTVIVNIADNGPGISDNMKETVFGKEEKGLESEGTGIGLYLVNELVKKYNGKVWIEDNKPVGTIFKIKLKKLQNGKKTESENKESPIDTKYSVFSQYEETLVDYEYLR